METKVTKLGPLSEGILRGITLQEERARKAMSELSSASTVPNVEDICGSCSKKYGQHYGLTCPVGKGTFVSTGGGGGTTGAEMPRKKKEASVSGGTSAAIIGLDSKAGPVMTWKEIQAIAEAKVHMLLFGPPGTGKTNLASTDDSYNITLTAETPAAELRGHYIPKGSEFIWHDGPAIRAWKEGKRLVLNEIDQASGDALTFLYVMLDDPKMARLTLPTGETVKPAPGFQAIATTNATDFQAMMPEALLDRFSVRINVTVPHPEALKRLAGPLANVVRSTITLDQNRKVSLRQALAYSHLEGVLGSKELAGKAVFGTRGTDVFNSIALAIAAETK